LYADKDCEALQDGKLAIAEQVANAGRNDTKARRRKNNQGNQVGWIQAEESPIKEKAPA
jgi:hypothetical protein